MKRSTFPLLHCPRCQGDLSLQSSLDGEWIEEGDLFCSTCGKHYPIHEGIAHFITYGELSGTNRRFARLYDYMSYVYRPASRIAERIGARFGLSRNDLIKRLGPSAGRVLEVSIGPGVNLPYLFDTPGVTEVVGLDISRGQLQRCRGYCRKQGWPVDLFLGQAEQLPFRDDTFDSVLHFGGINFFTDTRSAMLEMIRVARPGAPIVIGDETERVARVYEWTIPGFTRSFEGKRAVVHAPVDLVPPAMEGLRLETLWGGHIYCLSFRKPCTASPDHLHQDENGGTHVRDRVTLG